MDLIRCRVCLQHTYECVSLDAPLSDESEETTISDTIKTISSVSCSSDDGLPFLLCDNCIEELVRTCNFIAKIQESDKILRQELENSKNIIEISEEILITEGLVYETSYEVLDQEIINEVTEVIPIPSPPTETDDPKEKMHKCLDCGKEFRRRDYLSNHIRFVHKKVRPFLCSKCPNVYANNLRLKEHFRIHSGERPYKCEFCHLTFARNTTMIRHKLVHTGELPYQCKVCQKRFRQDSTLRGHMFIHTGIGVPCSICNKMFARKVDVRKHMVIHKDLVLVGS
ncbi:hypothetical protein ACFFRR_001763 [Megaselia abdita]